MCKKSSSLYLRLVHKICYILKKDVCIFIYIHIIDYSVIWNIHMYTHTHTYFFPMKENIEGNTKVSSSPASGKRVLPPRHKKSLSGTHT